LKELSEQEIQDLLTLARVVGEATYYDVLNVEDDASEAQLKRAFYSMSRRYHPDRFYRREVGEYESVIERVFTGITTAYEVLRDPLDRRRYDREIVAKVRRKERVRASRHGTRVEEVKPHQVSDHVIKFVVPEGRAKHQAETSGGQGVAEDANEETGEAAPRPKKKRRRKKKRSAPGPADFLRDRLILQLSRAKRYYEQGQADMEEGLWLKAAGSLYLAVQFDPRNPEYREHYQEARRHANQAKAAQYIALAENAESYRNIREAVSNYQRAVECDPKEGLAFYRLAELQRAFEEDPRGALRNYRRAVEKEPGSIRYRMALGNMYAELNMKNNASREFDAVLRVDPKNANAKEGRKKSR
jgi:tetratricopeptide (TPR) repeat protein